MIPELEITTADRLKLKAIKINTLMTKMLATLKRDHQAIRAEVIGDLDLTAEQIIESFGPNAAAYFGLDELVIGTVNAVAPDSYAPTWPFLYTVHSDGTATIDRTSSSSSTEAA